jgi:serine/threonine protein kinase
MITKSDIIRKYFPYSSWEEWHKKAPLFANPPLPPYEKTTTLKIPYQRSNLPHRLPTPQEIAVEVKSKRRLNGVKWGAPVIRIFDCYVVKVGGSSLVQEAENLLYLEEHCLVRAPKLYAAFMSSEAHCDTGEKSEFLLWYIVLEYIPGHSLESQVKLLSPGKLEEVATSFTEQMSLLRSVRLDSFHYGRVYNQAWSPHWLLLQSRHENPNMIGPFSTYEEWLAVLSDCAHMNAACSGFLPDLGHDEVETLERFWPTLSKAPSRPTLTHHDLKHDNMIIQEDSTGRLSVVIIDWQLLSWQPPWMDAVSLSIMTIGYVPEDITNRWDRVVEQSGIFSSADLETAKFFQEAITTLGHSFA